MKDSFEQGLTWAHHLGFIKLNHIGKVRRFTGDQLGDAAGRRVAYALPPRLHGVMHHLDGAALVLIKLLVPGREVVGQVAATHFLEQIFFGIEIQKQRAFRDTGQVRHFLYPGGSKPLVNEQRQRGIQQLLRTGFFAPFTLVRCRGFVGEGRGVRHINDWLVSNVTAGNGGVNGPSIRSSHHQPQPLPQHRKAVSQTTGRGQIVVGQVNGPFQIAHRRGCDLKTGLLKIAQAALHVPIIGHQQDAFFIQRRQQRVGE